MTLNRYRVVFMGTPEFAVPSLQTLINNEFFEVVAVVTQPDKAVGRKQVIEESPIKQVAVSHNIPVLQPKKVKNNAEFVERLKGFEPDLNVVVAYGKILPEEVLNIPQYGSVNVHGSELPKYRGASPIQAAILNGDISTKVSVQKMVFAMDEGPVIGIGEKIAIEPEDTYESLSTKMAESAARILPDTLMALLDGSVAPYPQDDSQATYVKIIHKEDGQIDWSQPEEKIERMVRAYLPWPTAWTIIDGMTVKILDADYVADSGIPRGQIGEVNKELFIGKLKINKLQLAGKNPISGREFLNGYRKYVESTVI